MSPIARWQDLLLPVGIIACVLVILVPLPAPLIDVLLATNITIALIVLLTTIYVRTPLEFSVFPSLLLATTLGRLVLNVATTRLILNNAPRDGLSASGQVIRAFGEFVTGGEVVIGLIIFLIIVLIQFIVITKGATRISEVAARFALDGMPGRQMAIDADLNAGLIDEKTAQRRRQEIGRQADFYGSMDGASKFVRGDAIAGIAITFINIMGGLFVGVIQSGMALGEATALFTKLTIGDGLASQIPAFLISLATGLLVTRSMQSENLPKQFLEQLFSRPPALAIAAGFLIILVFTNLPTLPLLTLGTGCGSLAFVISRQKSSEQSQIAAQDQEQVPAVPTRETRVEDLLTVDPMELELGIDLLRFADESRGGKLLPQITRVRETVAADIGIVLPRVRIRDNMDLGVNEYRIKISDNAVARGKIRSDRLLALETAASHQTIAGQPMADPSFGQPAVWIDHEGRDQAKELGYHIIPPTDVLARHLQEIVQRHADELLSRDATNHLLKELKTESPMVVDELIPKVLKLGEVQVVLQSLLREEIPIRQLALILETLGDYAPHTQDPIWLTEHVRHRLARTICTKYRDEKKQLHVVTLDPAFEDRINSGIEHSDHRLHIRMAPAAIESVCDLITNQVENLVKAKKTPVILVSPQTRPGLKQITSNILPQLVVLSFSEVTRDTEIKSVGIVTDANTG